MNEHGKRNLTKRLMPQKIDFDFFIRNPKSAPLRWRKSCVHTECSFHQLSPYIGKLKSSIARDLVRRYSKKHDLVVDPFAGAGTIPFEAVLLGRHIFASDISPYSKVLTKAKLSPPESLEDALTSLFSILDKAKRMPNPDLNKVPNWVRKFFHPQTLREAINFSVVCKKNKNDFLMACFLGILHHQRPGFLSYPSSHLVPYLRNKKYPKKDFPEMYEYRELRPRMIAKVQRAFKKAKTLNGRGEFRQSCVENLTLPEKIDCVITSPPYMNMLDYGRDNRLRLWFLNPTASKFVDNPVTEQKKAFCCAISALGEKIEESLRPGGYCVLVVGETAKKFQLSKEIMNIFFEHSPSLKLVKIIKDNVPDIRRARRDCRGTKREHILILRKRKHA